MGRVKGAIDKTIVFSKVSLARNCTPPIAELDDKSFERAEFVGRVFGAAGCH